MFLAIKLAIFMALLAGAGGAFLYVQNLQATVDLLEANNAKLNVFEKLQYKKLRDALNNPLLGK